MRLSRRIPSGVLCSFALAVVPAFGAQSTPPAAVAAMVGEWSGESSLAVNGSAVADTHRDARQYWVEGEIVRGEVLSGASGSLELYEVAIVPRNGHFLKVLTPENNEHELFVGVAAEGGVLWSAADGSGALHVERVVGNGAERRFEILLSESGNGPWTVAETLKPAEAVLSGVIGGSSRAAGQTKPLILPPARELALIDRIGRLLQQRDAARRNGENLAQELATAWRTSEEANAQVRELTRQLAAREEGESDDLLAAAQKEAEEARSWADELERSLDNVNAGRDQALERVSEMEVELAATQSALTEAEGQVAQLSGNLAKAVTRAGAAEATVVELETKVDRQAEQLADAPDAESLQRQLDTYEAAIEEAARQLEDVRAARDEAREALADRDVEIETLAARARELQRRLTAAEEGRDELGAMLASAQQRLDAAEALPATIEEQEETIATQQRRLTELEAQLEEVGSARQELQTQLAELESAHEALRDENQALAAKVEDAGKAASVELAELQEKLATTQAARDEFEAEAKRLGDELDRLTEEHGRVRETVESLTAGNEEHRTEIEARDERIAALEVSLETRQSETAALTADLAVAREQTSSLEDELATLREDRESAATERIQDLEESRAKIAELETELDRMRAAAPPVGEERDAAIVELETRLADTFARAERRAQEIEQLEARVAELQSERSALQARIAELAANRPTIPSAPATEPVDLVAALRGTDEAAVAATDAAANDAAPADTSSDAVVASARTGAAIPAPATNAAANRPARPSTTSPPSSPAAPAPTTASGPQSLAAVEFRLPPSPELTAGIRLPPSPAASPGARQPPTRPSPETAPQERSAGTNAFLAQVVRNLVINGYRGQGAAGVVVISGRLYQAGQPIAEGRGGLRFERIEGDAIVFADASGGEYRYEL